MRSLVIGMGEIGQAVKSVFSSAHTMRTVDLDKEKTEVFEGEKIIVMHICIPYSENFQKQVRDYIDRYSPKHVIIWSTVPIGTSKVISPKVIHSPVEGKHPDLELSIWQMERWIGHNDVQEGIFFVNYCNTVGLRTKLVENTDFTEALKLLSTTEYGVNIVFASYKARVAEEIGMDFDLAKDWNREYNRLYRQLGMDKRFQKYVLDPPQGKIGGHCVVPNAEILREVFPDAMLDMIINLGVKQ